MMHSHVLTYNATKQNGEPWTLYDIFGRAGQKAIKCPDPFLRWKYCINHDIPCGLIVLLWSDAIFSLFMYSSLTSPRYSIE